MTALLDAGMQLTGLVEHQCVPWQALPGQMELDDSIPRPPSDLGATLPRPLW
jgi:hypothetical protein